VNGPNDKLEHPVDGQVASLLDDVADLIEQEPSYFFLPHDIWLAGRGAEVGARVAATGERFIAAWRGTVGASLKKNHPEPLDRCRAAVAFVRRLMVSQLRLPLGPEDMPCHQDRGFHDHTVARLLGGASNCEGFNQLLALLLSATGLDARLLDTLKPDPHSLCVVFLGGDTQPLFADAWSRVALFSLEPWTGSGEVPHWDGLAAAGAAEGVDGLLPRANFDLKSSADRAGEVTVERSFSVVCPAERPLPPPVCLKAQPPPLPRSTWDARRLYLHARVLHCLGWGSEALDIYRDLASDFFVPEDVRRLSGMFARTRAAASLLQHCRRVGLDCPAVPGWLDDALGTRYRLWRVSHDSDGLVLHLDLDKRRGVDLRFSTDSGQASARLGALFVCYVGAEGLRPELVAAVSTDVVRLLESHEAPLTALLAATEVPSEVEDRESSEGLRPSLVLQHPGVYLDSPRPEDRATLALAAIAEGEWLLGLEAASSLDGDPLTVPWVVATAQAVVSGLLGERSAHVAWQDRLIGDPATPSAVLAALAYADQDSSAALGWFGHASGDSDWAALRRYLVAGLEDAAAGDGFAGIPSRESLANFGGGVPGLLIRAGRLDLAHDWLDRLLASGSSSRGSAWKARIALWELDLETSLRHAADAWDQDGFEHRLLRAGCDVLEGRHDQAYDSLLCLIEERPDHAEALIWMAEACTARGEEARGQDYATRALAKRNSLPAAVAGALAKLLRSKEATRGDTVFDGILTDQLPYALGIDPAEFRDAGSDVWIAGLREFQRRLGGNRSHWMVGLDAAGRLGPLEIPPNSRERSAATQFHLGPEPLENVLSRFEELAAEFPHSPHPLTFSGEVLLWAGRYHEAAETFELALKIRTCRWGFVGAAAAAMFLAEPEEARRKMKKMASMFEPVARATTPVYRGLLARKSGRFDEAEVDLEVCTREAPSRIGGWVERGLNARSSGDDDLAERCVAEVFDRCPGLVSRVLRDTGLPLARPGPEQRAVFLEGCLDRLVANRASRMVTVLDSGGLNRLPPPRPWALAAREALRLAARVGAEQSSSQRAEAFHPELLKRPRPIPPIMGRPRFDRRVERDFMEQGWVKLPGAIPRVRVDHWVDTAVRRVNELPSRWVKEPEHHSRRGFSPSDPSTWPESRLTFLGDRVTPFRAYSPELARAIDTLVGGQERLSRVGFSNYTIFAPGSLSHESLRTERRLWHVDEPHQEARFEDLRLNLLAVVLLSDVTRPGDGTAFVEGSAQEVARRIAASGGCLDLSNEGGQAQDIATALGTRSEVVGRRGDVFLLHPWTVHAAGQGLAGEIRILANPNLLGRDAPYRPGPPRSPVEALIHEALGQ